MKNLIYRKQALAPFFSQEQSWHQLQLMYKYSIIQLILSIFLLLDGVAFVLCLIFIADLNGQVQGGCAYGITLIVWFILALTAHIFENKYTLNVKTLGIIFADRKALYKLNRKITMCAFLLGLSDWMVAIKLFIWTKELYKEAKEHMQDHTPFFINPKDDKTDDGSLNRPTIWYFI